MRYGLDGNPWPPGVFRATVLALALLTLAVALGGVAGVILHAVSGTALIAVGSGNVGS